MSAEPSVKSSVEPPTQEAADKPLPSSEARPKAALARAFAQWAELLRPGSSVQLTDARAKAYFSRRKRDGFTEAQLLRVIDAAHTAQLLEEFNYPHHVTEFYRLFVDREHVDAWLAYEETGDNYVLSEMLLTEAPREAALVGVVGEEKTSAGEEVNGNGVELSGKWREKLDRITREFALANALGVDVSSIAGMPDEELRTELAKVGEAA